ncbi:phosphoribosyltransferase [Siccirubricoccus deserti]|nr:double zinc ribbon domain-containing protein [Siccirubricoccus deserti]GGC36929.1 phosphoribosyltransferase [Siccirubricoccus deserti]
MAMPASARLEPLRRFGRRLGIGALDLLLPPHCLTCDAAVDRQGTMCGPCFAGLSFVGAPCCGCCGVPFPHAGVGTPSAAGPLCPGCAGRKPSFGQARAALRYDAGSQRLILPFKHADRTELAGPLAAHMARAGAALLARADLLAPVPLHWRRLLSRRYNQAALLSARLARRAGKPDIPDLLRRRRATPPLGERGAAERTAVLAGAFAIARPARIAGRRVLLVDDVMTSGATAEACALALLEAGAAAVDVLAAARVPDPRLEAA